MNEWSKAVPTEEGWYWWRYSKDTDSLVPIEIPAKAPSGFLDHIDGEWCRIPSLADVERLRAQVAMLRDAITRLLSALPRGFAKYDQRAVNSVYRETVLPALTATADDVAAWQAAQPPAEPTPEMLEAGLKEFDRRGYTGILRCDLQAVAKAMIAAGEQK